jgi:hypothetical protein
MIACRSNLAALTLAVALLDTPALAQGAKASSPVELARKAEALKPGDWVWAPEIAPAGPLLVYVDLSTQRATVYRNGVRIAVSTVSSGKPGHATPTGVFTILQKDAHHRSSKYNNAPMPFTQRLTWDGIALHAGGLPGYPESHGCVHLPYSFAQALFGITSLGVTVVVQGDAADHVRTSSTSLLAPMDTSGKPLASQPLQDEQYRWNPQASPNGPLTIIISKSDQRIVVLRNGIEIGRSAAEITDDDPGSHVISLTKGADGMPHWVYVGLPGHSEDAGRSIDEAVLNRVRMPRDFYQKLHSAIAPGTTVLVTQSPVGASTGQRITILDAVNPAP